MKNWQAAAKNKLAAITQTKVSFSDEKNVHTATSTASQRVRILPERLAL